jgi:hypothetical protein
MTKLKIEKGIPLPPTTMGRARIYPFKEMEIGDSFFVPLNGRDRHRVQTSIIGSCRLARLTPKRFCTRYIKEPEEGYRCWRFE